jgi:hypothetical protein
MMKVLKLLYVLRIDCVLQLLVCVLFVPASCCYCSQCNSYCLFVCLCSVLENGGEFDDTLRPTDDEALSDDVCGSGT